MPKLLDQTHDANGQILHKLSKLYELPDYVKEASHISIAPQNLDRRLYADPVEKKFPCNTKEATWTSLLFLLHNNNDAGMADKHAYERVKTVLEKKAKFFGIYHDVKCLFTSMEKSAHDTRTEYALNITLPDDTVEHHYPLRNGLEVKEAASYLLQHRNDIPLGYRQQMSQNILDKAASYDVGLGELEDQIDKQAGCGCCAAEDAVAMLQTRISTLKTHKLGTDMIPEIEKVAKECVDHPQFVRERSALSKLACIVDTLDRDYGLQKYYSEDFMRPEDVLFSITIKSASALIRDNVTTSTGFMYKVSDFKDLSLDKLRDVFGDELANSVSIGDLYLSETKLAEHLTKISKDDAELMDKVLQSSNIVPVMTVPLENDINVWSSRDFLRGVAKLRQ